MAVAPFRNSRLSEGLVCAQDLRMPAAVGGAGVSAAAWGLVAYARVAYMAVRRCSLRRRWDHYRRRCRSQGLRRLEHFVAATGCDLWGTHKGLRSRCNLNAGSGGAGAFWNCNWRSAEGSSPKGPFLALIITSQPLACCVYESLPPKFLNRFPSAGLPEGCRDRPKVSASTAV